jgi:hypothetical protein
MDDADRAQSEIDRLLDEQLRNAHKQVPKFKPQGYCLHCGEDTTPVQIFCNSKCSMAYRG